MSQIFISYHHDDFDFAVNMRRELQGAGFRTWMDDEGIYAGEDWRQEIDRAIRESFALIAILSPKAVDSEYITYEWSFALGADIKVIPILFRHTDKLHPRLTSLQYEDFTNRLARSWSRLLARLEQIGATSSQSKAATRHKLPNYLQQAIDDLDDADVTKRSEAIDTLGQIDLPEAREALVAALEHPLQDMPFKVAIKLAKLKDQRAIPILLQRLKSNEYLIMESAAMALRDIGDPCVIPALVEAIPRIKGFMQMLVINSIAKIEDPATIPALITILQSETTSARDFASDALRNIGSPAVPALLEALNNSDSSSRALSAWTLGLIKDSIAVEPLIACLDDKGVSNVVISNAGRSINTIAAQALERIGTPEAFAAVEEWRKSQQSDTQS